MNNYFYLKKSELSIGYTEQFKKCIVKISNTLFHINFNEKLFLYIYDELFNRRKHGEV